MKALRTDIMGMPITVEIVAADDNAADIEKVFSYFEKIDGQFSTYQPDSEISRFRCGEIKEADLSKEVQEIFKLADDTKKQTNGFFDIWHNGVCDPSGLVKGWAILKAADILRSAGHQNFLIEAGGDIQASGKNSKGQSWSAGIRNPFKVDEIVKVVHLNNCGMATSGTYERGQHIYNPLTDNPITEIISLTVIGPNIYEADRFATAAFAMGKDGINFIESTPGLEGYVINKDGIATETSGFTKLVDQ